MMIIILRNVLFFFKTLQKDINVSYAYEYKQLHIKIKLGLQEKVIAIRLLSLQ